MTQAKAIIQHICATITSELKSEFPGLSIVCVIYEGKGFKKSLTAKSGEVAAHPAGQDLLKAIQDFEPTSTRFSEFIGLSISKKTNIVNMLAKKKAIALICVNADLYQKEEQAKTEVYSRIFSTLRAYGELTNKNKKAQTATYKTTITQQTLGLTLPFQNMLGYVFTALYLEISGRNGAIIGQAKKYTTDIFKPIIGITPEDNPYPLTLDMTKVVYEEMASQKTDRTTAFQQAQDMTQEIALTCDESITRQWDSFIEPAIEMVWSNAEPKEILGAAAYTSESVFNRSTAYLIAEILNIEPASSTSLPEFNAFADTETQQRLHTKVCEQKFEKLIHEGSALKTDKLPRAAKKQCEELLNGIPIGWCAPALLEASAAITSDASNDDNITNASNAFYTALQTFRWEHVKNLHKDIIDLKRKDQTPDIETIIGLLQRNPQTMQAAKSLTTLK